MDGTIECDCGEQLPFRGSDDAVSCDCGGKYVVTITELREAGTNDS